MSTASTYYNMPASGLLPVIDLDDDSDDNGQDTSQGETSALTINEILGLGLGNLDRIHTAGEEELSFPEPILESQSLLGEWTGFCAHGFSSSTETEGTMFCRIEKGNLDGSVGGVGSDPLGDFSITGTFKHPHVSLIAVYMNMQPLGANVTKRLFEGVVTENYRDITGKCGPFMENREENNDVGEEVRFLGTFKLNRRSLAYAHLRPSEVAFQNNKPRALWKFALDSTLHALSGNTLRWSLLNTRRDQRQRFIALFIESQQDRPLDSKLAKEYSILQESLSEMDLRYYYSLAKILYRQNRVQVFHK